MRHAKLFVLFALLLATYADGQGVVFKPAGGPVLGGSVPTNTVPKSSSSGTSLVASQITDDGTTVQVVNATPKVVIGPVGASDSLAELYVDNETASTEIHAKTGLTTGYAGFGARNDRGVDGGGVTISGGALVSWGSAASNVIFGYTIADFLSVFSSGVSSQGLIMGSLTAGKPVIIGTSGSVTPQEPRIYIPGDYKASITSGSPATFVRVAVPSGTISGGKIDFSIWAAAGSDLQTRSGTTWYSIVNKAGTETCTIGTTAGTDLQSNVAVSVGTLTVAFASSNAPTNACDFTVTGTSSLTTPTMGMNYSVYKNAGTGAITPQ